MESKISFSERIFKALIKSKEALLEDAKLKNYNPFRLNPVMLSSLVWWKNITKMCIVFLLTFLFSPKGMFIDLKEGRIKNFLVKIFILFFISIPFTLVFFSFCLLLVFSIITPIITLVLKLIS